MSLDGAILRQRFPMIHFCLRSIRYALKKERPDATTARLIGVLCGSDPRVLWGPFVGMRYGRFACGSGLLPKIAGTYELELHGAIAESLAREPQRVINIGAGEGYYAVGYARALPGCRVFAFDTDPLARQRLRQLARQNGVADRVQIGGGATAAHLIGLAGQRVLIVSDCEGCERELLDPERAPQLVASDLLVESHDFLVAGTTDLLTERFSVSHRVTRIEATVRGETPPHLSPLSAGDRRQVVYEGRPPGMQWLWMKARPEPGLSA